MRLQGKVIKSGVIKNKDFDTLTGNPHPSYFIEAIIFDTEANQAYRCAFKDIPDAKRLSQAYKEKWPETKRDALAAEVAMNAKQYLPENEDVTLMVYQINENPLILLARKI